MCVMLPHLHILFINKEKDMETHLKRKVKLNVTGSTESPLFTSSIIYVLKI